MEPFINAVQYVLSIPYKVWSYMCLPFIDKYEFTWGGGRYEPYWPIVLVPLGIGLAFCCIALAKTLIRKLLERG